MFALRRAILLVSMRTGNLMSYANALKKGIQGLILSPPISLYGANLAIKLSFNKILKILKTLKNFRFVA
jgi:hypothetical protein